MGRTTIIGAVINIILNIILIYFIGTIGAAISTMISYIVVWFSRIKMLKNIINLEVNLYRDCIGYLILIVQAVVINILNIGMRIYIIEGILLISLIMLYNKEIKGILDKIWVIIVKKNLKTKIVKKFKKLLHKKTKCYNPEFDTFLRVKSL